MKEKVRSILNRYRWDRIFVWSGIIAFCVTCLLGIGMLLVTGCNRMNL